MNNKIIISNIGKIIVNLEIIFDEDLVFTFGDGIKMILFDNGQMCCEARWMHTDDVLNYYTGAIFQGIEIKEGPEGVSESGEEKESEFLMVSTDKGQFTVVNYNEHNGSYGGFALQARLEEIER